MKGLIIVVILGLVVSGFFPQVSSAKDDPAAKKAWVAGKVFDTDKVTPLVDLPIRIVNVESGEMTEVKTRDEGCYRFKGVYPGSYSVAVTYKGMDYLLPEKVQVGDLQQHDVAVTVCVAIPENGNSLVLLDNCSVCREAGFLPVGVLLIGGSAAAVGGILIGHSKEPVVSESRPQNPR
jgi:hypothetical protein